MYQEPHLREKSQQCKMLWNIWYEMMTNKDPLAPTARKTWLKCVDEFSIMISDEYSTNQKYDTIKKTLE